MGSLGTGPGAQGVMGALIQSLCLKRLLTFLVGDSKKTQKDTQNDYKRRGLGKCFNLGVSLICEGGGLLHVDK